MRPSTRPEHLRPQRASRGRLWRLAAPILTAGIGVVGAGAGAQGTLTLSGTVNAAPGSDVKNTVVIACAVVNGKCDESDAQVSAITVGGKSAPFTLGGLNARPYLLLAWRDLNGNKQVDDGDHVAQLLVNGQGAPVTPPARGLTLQLTVAGQGQAGAAPPQTTPPATTPATGTNCTKSNPVPKTLATQPGVVRGYVVNSCGQPLTGTRVIVRNAFARSTDVPLRPTVKPDGTYSQALPGGVWQVWAELIRQYDGSEYCLWQYPDDQDPVSALDGGVRNVVWHLNGERPDSRPGLRSYYGGRVVFYWSDLFSTGGTGDSVLTVQLQPTAPLVDGSRGQTITAQGTVSQLRDAAALQNVPLGRYRLTMTVRQPGNPQTYRAFVRLNGQGGPHREFIEGTFSSSGRGSGDIGCGETGTLNVEVSLQP